MEVSCGTNLVGLSVFPHDVCPLSLPSKKKHLIILHIIIIIIIKIQFFFFG